MPSGPCRQPLGRMTKKGLQVVVEAAKQVQKNNPEIFEPIATHFNINIDDRLNNPEYQKNLYYDY